MVQLLHLTLELTENPDGSYEAYCPELRLSATGRHEEEAIDRLREIVFSSMTDGFDCTFNSPDAAGELRGIVAGLKHCYLYIPRNPRIH